jgi:hypothetical protein
MARDRSDRAANLLEVIFLITAKGEDLALSHGGHGLSPE